MDKCSHIKELSSIKALNFKILPRLSKSELFFKSCKKKQPKQQEIIVQNVSFFRSAPSLRVLIHIGDKETREKRRESITESKVNYCCLTESVICFLNLYFRKDN